MTLAEAKKVFEGYRDSRLDLVPPEIMAALAWAIEKVESLQKKADGGKGDE